ncbi:MAG: DUF2934 domain-containing protein [Bauldia sp.]
MPTTIPTDDEIRLRAYHLWDINGRQDGRDLDYWLQAALELEDVAGAPGGGAVPADPAATVAANLDRPTPGGLRRSA